MASKRHIRRKQCEGKLRFPDQIAAERHARRNSRAHRTWLTAYHCSFCSGYHVGHPPARIRRAIQAKRSGI